MGFLGGLVDGLSDLDPSKINWDQVDPNNINWDQVDPSRINFEQADPSKIRWEQLDPNNIKWEQIGPYVKLRFEALSRWTKAGVGSAVAWVKKQWWYRRFQAFGLSMFMEPPNIQRFGQSFPGEPVYYVNGMLTKAEWAAEASKKLANHLRRPVYLIYNPTANVAADLAECYYDRLWIHDVVGLFQNLMATGLFDTVLGKKPTLQMNKTTRQVAHLLYHSDRPISIVSHSQGCMIVRNAAFTLFLLSKESWVRSHLAWIAAGTPLNDNEVWPPSRKFASLRNDGDPVARLLAFSGNVNDWKDVSLDHDFMQTYIPQISGDMLWPPGSGAIGPGRDSIAVPIVSTMMHK